MKPIHKCMNIHQVDSAAQVAMTLANITDVTENVQSEDVAIASTLLVRVADSADVQDVDVSQRELVLSLTLTCTSTHKHFQIHIQYHTLILSIHAN